MANAPDSNRPIPGKRGFRRMLPKIDFTPMVDLGFLLITFFMLSTSLSKPSVMPLVLPDTDGKAEPVKASKTLTLLLEGSDKIYWYEGLETGQMKVCDYQRSGLRQVLLGKMTKVAEQFGLEAYNDPKTSAPKKGSYINIIIKPCPGSRYKNLVDALDEMNICRIRYYCILDPSGAELQQINKLQTPSL